nr:hypothetical protein [Streptomyces sp. DSM 41633]
MTADANRRLLSMDLDDDDDVEELDGWGNRAALNEVVPVSASIPVLFDAQVARHPDAVAVSLGASS